MHRSNSHQTPTRVLVHHFPAQAKALGETRDKVRIALSQYGCSQDIIDDVVLAIDEACQNIIRHAYGNETNEQIAMQIQRQEDGLIITLRDYAPLIESDCMKPRNLEDIRPGGLGCHFIQQIMDNVSIKNAPEGNGNILQMIKYLS
ncbi:MAG: ATP-binding protein [Nitrospirales bacterium]